MALLSVAINCRKVKESREGYRVKRNTLNNERLSMADFGVRYLKSYRLDVRII